MTKITKSIYGTTKTGKQASCYRLENSHGFYVTITDFGGTILSFVVPNKKGEFTDIVLGYRSLTEYEQRNGAYFGALIGRCGNRIANGTFSLNGKDYSLACNNGPNHLHGGIIGFSHKIWNASIEQDALKLTLHSPDGEEGYPGNLDVTVTYTWNDQNILGIHYEAISDADTLVNLTNHTYFNLNGHDSGTIENQMLKLFASSYLPTDSTFIPTGEIRSVIDTPFDFRKAKPIGQDLHANDTQIQSANGYDHNFVLENSGTLSLFAEAYSETSGIGLRGKTTLPGVQVYTGNGISNEIPCKNGATYAPYQGFALETQLFPDGIHHEHFPSPILKAGEKYDTMTTYEIFTP